MRYNLHTHSIENNPDVIAIVNCYPYESIDNILYFSTGIHPWYINEQEIDSHLAIIEQRLQMPTCLALGECGLDKRIETPLAIQQEVFEKQLLLAKQYKKPVILHCVAAYQEVIEIKHRLEMDVPMVIHGFSKNEQVAAQLLSNGFYLSFGKYLLRNPELSSVLASVPSDKFFLETDSLEEGIDAVYEKAALAQNIKMQDLKDIIQTNFKTVFRNGGVD